MTAPTADADPRLFTALPRCQHLCLYLSLCLLPASGPAAAERLRHGDYDVFYSVLPSVLVPEPVARAHGLVRADNRLLVNIAVRRHGAAVEARLDGHARNLLGQRQRLDFVEVTEPGAIYYLASVVVGPGERLRFEVRVDAGKDGEPLQLRFHNAALP